MLIFDPKIFGYQLFSILSPSWLAWESHYCVHNMNVADDWHLLKGKGSTLETSNYALKLNNRNTTLKSKLI